MAKSGGDSKLAVAGALTLVLAIAGVLLVKEPLRSSRPVGTGLDMKQSSGEQLVRARLWEDPVAAVERAIREKGAPQPVAGTASSLAQRLSTLREAIAGRSDYFDIWNYPLLLLCFWALNVLLALLAALLLYQAANKAKAAMLTGLSRQMVQALGVGQDRDVRMKQVQFIIDEVEAKEQGAFVPLYQQPVIESSLYGIVALLQYLYMR